MQTHFAINGLTLQIAHNELYIEHKRFRSKVRFCCMGNANPVFTSFCFFHCVWTLRVYFLALLESLSFVEYWSVALVEPRVGKRVTILKKICNLLVCLLI